jgi:hypothetical protein
MDELQRFISKQPCYEQHVIEIKNIYESWLFSILVPNIYEGFESLYQIAEKFEKKFIETMKNNPNVDTMSVLVIFQKLLCNIPDLNTHKIKGETDRIKTSSRSADVFDDLVKAVIKSNIILMTYNIDAKRKVLLQTRYHDSIISHDFVHSCYVESARSFHSRPELFWTGYDNSMINQNKRTCHDIIKNAVRESINLALPMKEILSEYLTNPYEMKDDIRIYVIGEHPNIDTKHHIHQASYPDFSGNSELVNNATRLSKENEEYMDVEDAINRDLGIYIGTDKNVRSLLESDDEDTHDAFEDGLDNENGKANLSLLLGSDSDKGGNSNDRDSLLEDDINESTAPGAIANQLDGSDKQSEYNNKSDKLSNGNSGNDSDNKSDASIKSNQVVEGIKMIKLNTVTSGRGQAKTFFNEILPEAEQKANKHRQKIRENTNLKLEENNKKAGRKSDSDQSGIKITRSTEMKDSAKDASSTNRSSMTHNSMSHNSASQYTGDVTTDNVEELLNNILK